MSGGSEELAINESAGPSFSGIGGINEAGSFECNICLELAQDPIVTLCGHLFCWPCLYKWLHFHAHTKDCPVCKALIEEDKLVPLYGRGKVPTDPRSKSIPSFNIPNRPAGQRPAAASPDPENFPLPSPWLMDGIPMSRARFGSYTFSTAIGGLFPYLNFQVHGFPDSTAYAPAAGFPYGYPNTFHGGHAHGFNQPISQGQQADVFLKGLLIMVGLLLIAVLICF